MKIKLMVLIITTLITSFSGFVFAESDQGSSNIKTVDEEYKEPEKLDIISNSPANKESFESKVTNVPNENNENVQKYLDSQVISFTKAELAIYGFMFIVVLLMVARIIIAKLMGTRFVLVQSHNYLKLKRIKTMEDVIKTYDGTTFMKQDVKFLRIPFFRPVEVYVYDVTVEEVTLKKYQRAIEAEFTKAMGRDGMSLVDMIVVGVCIVTVLGLGFVYFKLDTLMQLLGVVS